MHSVLHARHATSDTPLWALVYRMPYAGKNMWWELQPGLPRAADACRFLGEGPYLSHEGRGGFLAAFGRDVIENGGIQAGSLGFRQARHYVWRLVDSCFYAPRVPHRPRGTNKCTDDRPLQTCQVSTMLKECKKWDNNSVCKAVEREADGLARYEQQKLRVHPVSSCQSPCRI